MTPTEKTNNNTKSEKQTNKVGDSRQLLFYPVNISRYDCLYCISRTMGEYRYGE